jgi:hypothetical protein
MEEESYTNQLGTVNISIRKPLYRLGRKSIYHQSLIGGLNEKQE